MNEIAVAAFSTSIDKICLFKFFDEFFYFR